MTIEYPTEFSEVYKVLSDNIVDEVSALNFPKEASLYLKKMFDYNVPGGKCNRGLSVFHSFKILRNNNEITEKETFLAHALGWCVEFLQAFFLVADDLMDHSKTRRGQPCWYLLENIGNMAVNDSFLLESCIYKVLKKYFKNTDYYVQLLELLHEVTFQTELGQLMDLLTAPVGKTNINQFNIERYNLIVQYKTAYYSFYLPVALAMLMAGIKDESVFKMAESILLPLGQFFQIQDDYLDCYGDPKTIGKIGTDIEDNKCSWLVVQALKLANAEQRKILELNYGHNDPEKVKIVKQLYIDLNLQQVYRDYEEESYQKILDLIKKLDNSCLDKIIFLDFAGRIYKRQK